MVQKTKPPLSQTSGVCNYMSFPNQIFTGSGNCVHPFTNYLFAIRNFIRIFS